MERGKPESLGDVLGRFLHDNSLESPLIEPRLIQHWGDVAGVKVSSKTTSIYVNAGCLYVHISSPALKANLQMRREELVRRLNESVGTEQIREIKIL